VNILAIDPGTKTGWCVYDSDARRVIEAGTSEDIDVIEEMPRDDIDFVVIERPKGYGPTRPQLVDCGWVCGYVTAAIECGSHLDVEQLTRLEVCKALTEATHGEVRVRNDATAWAALKLLHGEGCDKKGGALHGVRAHERAALAVAVAWSLRNTTVAQWAERNRSSVAQTDIGTS